MSLQIYALVSKDWYSVVVKPGLIRMAGVSVCMRAVAVARFMIPEPVLHQRLLRLFSVIPSKAKLSSVIYERQTEARSAWKIPILFRGSFGDVVGYLHTMDS
jgi:hypothetical protein